MRQSLRSSVMMIALLLGTTMSEAQPASDARVADLVRTGKLRVALFLPQYSKDPVTGEVRGNVAYMEVARALAARIAVDVHVIALPTPPKAVECLKGGACDVAFLGIEASRAVDVDFSPPVFELDYTFLVPPGSSIRRVADADRAGIRIAVVRKHASTLTLSRMLKHAEQVAVDIPDAAFELLRKSDADAFASIRPVLLEYSARLPGSRVLDDRYGANLLAIAVAKGQAGRLGYISQFVEEAKASGLVQRAVEHDGEPGIHVAPPGGPSAQK